MQPAIPASSFYPREMKTCVHKKMYMGMFMAALFIFIKTEKNLSVHQKWMDK